MKRLAIKHHILGGIPTELDTEFEKRESKLKIKKKHAFTNYYDTIDVKINDANKNNNKVYWKL